MIRIENGIRVILFLLTVFTSCFVYSQEEHHLQSGRNTIHLTTFGTGSPILVINGGPGMNSEGFQAMAKVLGQSHQAILYDQRGTGQSKMTEINEHSIKLDSMVKDIETIRDQLNIKHWIVLGHSFGGMLASYYTSKHPDRVRGLILSSSGGIDSKILTTLNVTEKLTELERDSLAYWRKQINNGDTSYFARYQKGKYLAPAYVYDKSHVPIVAHRLTQVDLKINSLVIQDMLAIGYDCSDALSSFTKPVLIIQGAQDIIDRSISERAEEVFSNSTLVILDKCGHYGWLDQPDQYFETISSFLKNLEQTKVLSGN